MSGGDLIVENTNVNGVTIDEITLSIYRIESDGFTPETPEAFQFSDLTARNNGAEFLCALDSYGCSGNIDIVRFAPVPESWILLMDTRVKFDESADNVRLSASASATVKPIVIDAVSSSVTWFAILPMIGASLTGLVITVTV
jgi:hypothetical protein